MALRANKNTFIMEDTGGGPGTEVRRQVMAGDIVFQGEPESAGDFDEVDVEMTAGLGAAPPFYKRQLDEHGRVKDEHAPPEVEDAAPPEPAASSSRRRTAKAKEE